MDKLNGLWIFAEQSEGEIHESVFEMLAKAKELQRFSGESVCAVLLGDCVSGLARTLIERGADEVIVAEHPLLAKYSPRCYQQALTQLVMKYRPNILLYPASMIGCDLAPRMMVALNTGLTAGAIDLCYDEDGVFCQTTPGYGGKVFAHITIPERRPQMATVRAKLCAPLAPDSSRTGEVVTEQVNVEADPAWRVIKREPKCTENVSVEQAKVLISGGRGVKNENDLKLLERLAELLGGAVCGSRAMIDNGLLSRNEQVGQSGKIVTPELIVNVAVSGAIQYKVGMMGSKLILTVNRDVKAPIFGYSHCGAVADYRTLLPELIHALERLKLK